MHIRLSYVLLMAALALAACFDVLFYHDAPIGLNVLLAELLFLGVSIALVMQQKLALTFAAKVAAGFALAFAATIAIWTSPWSIGLCFAGFVVANILFVVFVLGASARFRHPVDVLFNILVVPVIHAIDALPFARTLMPQKLSERGVAIVKAVIISLPILAIFLAIFAAADPVFQSYITGFFDWVNSWLDIDNVVAHGFFIGFFVVPFGLFFAAAFWKRKPHVQKPHTNTVGAVLESKIILGSVAVLFGIFILISSAALFGGEAAFTATDSTYASYARQGFGQLCAAAALVIVLIMTLRVLHTENVDRKLLGLQSVLLVEAGLVLISAFMRLSLYIGSYGYTPARLFGIWFFSLVGLLLLMTLANVILRKPQHALVTQMLVATGVAILLFTVSAPDARAVRLNLAWAERGHELPTDYGLYGLSEEAYPAILDVYAKDVAKEGIRSLAPSIEDYCTGLVNKDRAIREDYQKRVRMLEFIKNTTVDSELQGWQAWNWSRSRAEIAHDAVNATPEWLVAAEAVKYNDACGNP